MATTYLCTISAAWTNNDVERMLNCALAWEWAQLTALSILEPMSSGMNTYPSFRAVFEADDVVMLHSMDTLHMRNVNKVGSTADTPPAQVFENTAAKVQEQAQQPSSTVYNHKCEVHMPGQALGLYNEVMLCEDACTDRLQSALNDGWRIIAACPQPDQRRPDYILGRFNPKFDACGVHAQRG